MRPRDALVHACLDGACLAAPACPHHAFPARGLRGGLRTSALAATRHACALTWRSPSCEHRRAEYEAANSSNFDCVYPADAPKVRNTYELLLISTCEPQLRLSAAAARRDSQELCALLCVCACCE